MRTPTPALDMPSSEEIAIRAREIYEYEGRPAGREGEHWLMAELALIAEREQALRQRVQVRRPRRKSTWSGTVASYA